MANVKITSKHSGPILVKIPDLNFRREWMDRGSSVMVDSEKLEEMMYDHGFRYMIESGMLYIEDLQVKKDLGLEPEDATKPVNLVPLEESQMRRAMTVLPLSEFKIFIKTLTYEQMLSLADYAIYNELGDFQKAQVVKESCGKDILKAIELNRQDKEG